MHTDMPFGRWLKRRRVELQLTQAELARRVSYSVVTIRKIESEELRPSLHLAERLADHLAIPTEDRAAFIRFARGLAGGVSAEGFPPRSWYPNLVPEQRPVRLPVPPTELVGREREVASVRNLLFRGSTRLLTLTGSGGVGKTRLALEVARELVDHFPDGVYFVDLSPLTDPQTLTHVIASALGIQERVDAPLLEVLRKYLQDRKLLLLLDSFEPLVSAAPLIAELLSAAPYTTFLVTSREALRLRGEHEFQVQPLATPTDPNTELVSGQVEVEALLHYPAIKLFLRRAADVQTDFALSADNAALVVDICARLDGLPLAIELAAARMRLFTLRDLAERLSARLSLLVGGPRDLPARQRTLRDTIEWSYGLLSAPEQRVFRRLSVFAGGSTLEAAEAVCNASGDTETGPLSVGTEIESLVDKNLLWRREAENGKVRVGMLETVREYALEQLNLSGEAPVTRERHAGFFLRLAETAEPELRGPNQMAYLVELEAEHDNLRAALRWAVDTDSDNGIEIALRLAGALRWFWTLRSHVTEGFEWVTAVLRKPRTSDEHAHARAKALWCAGVLGWLRGDKAALSLLQESAEKWRSIGDQRGLAYSLQHLGLAVLGEGDSEKGRSLELESLALFRAQGDRPGESLALLCLASAAIGSGDLENAGNLLASCVRISRETGDKWVLALALRDLGRVAARRHDYAEARSLFEESIFLLSGMGTKHELATTLDEAAAAESEIGEPARAMWLWQQAVILWRDLGATRREIADLRKLGRAARLQGDYDAARLWLNKGLAKLRPLNEIELVCEVLYEFGALATADGQAERAERLYRAAEALRLEVAGPGSQGAEDIPRISAPSLSDSGRSLPAKQQKAPLGAFDAIIEHALEES